MADIRIMDLPGLASPTSGDVLIIHDTETRTDKKITYNALVASKIEELRSQIGSPLIASTAAGMTDVDRVYVYVGSETGYTAGNWYYYDGTQWVSGGTYNSVAIGDNTITDAKLIQAGGVLAEVHDIRNGYDGTTYTSAGDAVRGQINQVLAEVAEVAQRDTGSGLTTAIKDALLQLAQKVAYIDDDGQTYYDDLYDALYPTYTVTLNLTGVTSSNSATSVTDGSAYTATLTATTGYIAGITITMDGVDITATAWTPNT